MIKLRGYLFKYKKMLALAIVLLFVNVFCDLNLPNYMSSIVNVGIQQNGIEYGAPEVISKQGYEFISNIVSNDDKNELNTFYKEQKGFKRDNISVNDTDVFALTANTSGDQKQKLSNIYGKAIWTYINILKSLNNSTQNSNSKSGFDNAKVEDFYKASALISRLPQSTIDNAKKETSKLEPELLKSSSVQFVKLFYEELKIDINKIRSDFIWRIGYIMLAISILGGILVVSVAYLSSMIAAKVARNLRRDVFKKVSSFSNVEHDKFSTATLITRTTNDATQIQSFLAMGIRLLCYAPLMGIGGAIMAINKSASMSWIIGLACLLIILTIVTLFAILGPMYGKLQKFTDRLNLVAREKLNGLLVIRAFGRKDFEIEKFEKVNREFSKTNLLINQIMAFLFPIIILVMNGITLLVIWVGAHKIQESTINVGDMMAFLQYAIQIIMSFLLIAMMFMFLPRAAVSSKRIYEVLNTPISISNPKSKQKPKTEKIGEVEFKNVTFKYNSADNNALENISFVAKKGKTTAIIGSTGSGKTTLLNLLPRFYDINSGTILVNGVDIKKQNLNDLRNNFGYVPQKAKLFSGTILSNITYGKPDADEELINKIIEVSASKEIVDNKPKGLEEEIAQGGANVSGGQKQRLSIARALAKIPNVFIFDDSFSALDYKTDSLIRSAIKKFAKSSTVIVVAQRISTVMNADQIIVLDNGKIVGTGKHEKLLTTCKEYLEIASSQLSKKELKNGK